MAADSLHLEALTIASRVAAEAAELLRDAQANIGEIRNKSNHRDWVTQWDTRAEDLIVSRLAEFAPGVPVLAEESGQHGSENSESYWLVDPIDGTINFAHGLPLFGICISLEEAGQPVAAAIEAPAMNWTFAASLNGGSTCNGVPMSVSKRAQLKDSILASGFPYDRAETGHNFPQWEHFQRNAGACRRFGAASLDLCMVARGMLDGYWETRLSPWDLSAGALMVREAGGCVTGITGERFSAKLGHAIASNGAIHKEILDELRVVGVPSH